MNRFKFLIPLFISASFVAAVPIAHAQGAPVRAETAADVLSLRSANSFEIGRAHV